MGKSSLYDLGMKVPLVMNWPNGIMSPGRTYSEIVSHVDIVPTLLTLTGASHLPTRPMDGVSLVSVLNGSSVAVREDVFCEIGYAREFGPKHGNTSLCVTRQRFISRLPALIDGRNTTLTRN